MNLNSSDCRALKIIQNDTKLESISWELKIEKRFLNFCVGKTVRGKSPEVLRVFSKDSLLNLEHFDTNLKGATDCRKKF